MKSLFSFTKISLGVICLLFTSLQINAQNNWSGSGVNFPAYRYGNTGIGTPSPEARLHLMESGKDALLLRMHKYDPITLGHSIWDIDLNKYGYFTIGNKQNPATSGNFNRFTIATSGNVGIGTTTPSEKLEVIGSGHVSKDLFVGDFLGIGTTTPSQQLTISHPDKPVLRFERQGSNWDYEIYVGSGGHMRFRGGGSGTGDNGNGDWGDKMVITGQGYVGIGMSSVSNSMIQQNGDGEDYLLYVKGGILTEEVKVETGWCDYVFEKDYPLLPLEEVESHIAAKGHLHNTPSGKTIESEGLELKSMTVNQQEKIEELFLHVIEMNKKMKELEAKNEQLEAALASTKK